MFEYLSLIFSKRALLGEAPAAHGAFRLCGLCCVGLVALNLAPAVKTTALGIAVARKCSNST